MRRLHLVLDLVVVLLVVAAVFAHGGTRRKITIWSFAPNNAQEYLDRKAEVESRFGIDLEIRVVNESALVRKLHTAMVEGRGVPDIVEWKIETDRFLNADPERCPVMPLDEMVQRSAAFSKIVPDRIAWVERGGHVYGLPHDVHPVVLVYNDSLWSAAGVDLAAVRTWDEFFEASKKLLAEKKDGRPLHYALPDANVGLYTSMFMIWQQSGSQILYPDGSPQLANPAFAAFVHRWLEWRKTGAFAPWDWKKLATQLADGSLASFVTPDWLLPQVDLAALGVGDNLSSLGERGIRKGAVKYRFKVRSLPAYEAGGPTSASWGGSFMGIPRGTDDPAFVYRVMEFLEYDPTTLVSTRWEKTTMLPPIASVWSDPAFQKPDPRFGGQKLGEIMVAAAQALPRINTGDVFWDAIAAFNQEYQEMAKGRISVEEGLIRAQEKTRSRYSELARR